MLCPTFLTPQILAIFPLFLLIIPDFDIRFDNIFNVVGDIFGSLFGIIGFGIEAGKRDDLGKRLERTGEQWEKWFDDNGSSTTDSYYGAQNLDSIIDPVLEELRDENTTYDITIHTNPDKGVNLNISTKKETDSL